MTACHVHEGIQRKDLLKIVILGISVRLVILLWFVYTLM